MPHVFLSVMRGHHLERPHFLWKTSGLTSRVCTAHHVSHLCFLVCSADAYTMQHLQLRWSDTNALEISPDLELPQFSLTSTHTNYCTKTYTTGKGYNTPHQLLYKDVHHRIRVQHTTPTTVQRRTPQVEGTTHHTNDCTETYSTGKGYNTLHQLLYKDVHHR